MPARKRAFEQRLLNYIFGVRAVPQFGVRLEQVIE
jgi:hypothetical protein